MKTLLTQGEVCERLRIKYGTLNRMMNAGEFIASVNGRGRKLLFDPDALELWIRGRQQREAPPPSQRRRDKKALAERQAAAQAALDRHNKGGAK